MLSRDILHRTGGIILIESTEIIWFSRQSGWGSWSLLSEAKSLKTTQVRSSGSSPLKLDGSPDGQAVGCSRAVFTQVKAKGDYQAWVHSDQKVLVIIRLEAGTVA